MKTALKIIFSLLLVFSVKLNLAQVDAIPYYHNLNFRDAFFVIAESDAKSNYYAVNLSSFNSEAEKIYFEKLAFDQPALIRINSGNNNIAWFRVKKLNPTAETKELLMSLKSQATSFFSGMSEEQKRNWLTLNKK
ncbi:MAG TPA: hypothetical protein VF868_01815 [Bacteroidia bacterium]|jgi:hypothetical protein